MISKVNSDISLRDSLNHKLLSNRAQNVNLNRIRSEQSADFLIELEKRLSGLVR